MAAVSRKVPGQAATAPGLHRLRCLKVPNRQPHRLGTRDPSGGMRPGNPVLNDEARLRLDR